jgi:hypothetical protein
MPRSFSGPEFLKALIEGTLKPSLFRVGMVKPCDQDAYALMFAEGASCEHWVKIPLDMIESIEHLGDAPCVDHQHPRVRLHLKDAPPESREAAVYASLLRLSTANRAAEAWQPSEPGIPDPPWGPPPPPLPRGDNRTCIPKRGRCKMFADGRFYQWHLYRDCSDEWVPCD